MIVKAKYNLIVVGDGIMGNLLLYRYFKAFPNHRVLQISAADLAPPVSNISTAVVTKRNVQKGLSELGDKIFDAHESFLDFYSDYRSKGIEKCLHETRCSLTSEKIENFKRRYPKFYKSKTCYFFQEDGYLFTPEVFLESLREELSLYEIDRVKDFIYQENDQSIQGKYDSYYAPRIFLGLGPYSAKWKNLISYPVNLKEVRGSYLSFHADFENSFSFTIDGLNLLYRKSVNQLIFGNSQFEGEIGSYDFENLKEKFQVFRSHFEKELPCINEAKYCSGFRAKASKRLPHWGVNEYGHFYATGFWKNGYTLSFLASDQIVKSWTKESVS